LKLEELKASLEAHKLRSTDRNIEKDKGSRSDQAWQAQYEKKGKYKKGKNYWKDQVFKNGEGSSKNQESFKKDEAKHASSRKKTIDKKDIQCYNFQKWGHYASECRSKRVQRNKGDEAQFDHNEGYDSNEVFLLATIKTDDEHNGEWYLDTRCSTHMIGKKSWFSD